VTDPDITPYVRALQPERPRLRKPEHMLAADYRARALDSQMSEVTERRDLPARETVHETAEMARAFARDDGGPPGYVKPGSYEEADALAEIDAARAIDVERERQNSGRGRIVSQRIEHGRLIGFVSRGRGRGLDRVFL
jgi:hypothetical protein